MGKQPKFNWLQSLDSIAPKLERAHSWLNYDYFMFARYPYLRPEGDAFGHETFEKTVSGWEARLANHEQAQRALEGLQPERRKQLAALVCDCAAEFEMHKSWADVRGPLTKIGSEAPRRQRRIVQQYGNVSRGLRKLRDYVSLLDPLLAEQYRGDVEGLLEEASRATRRAGVPRDWVEIKEEIRRSHPCPADPAVPVMAMCFWFFHHECKLPQTECEVRVAVIRAAFWDTSNFEYRLIYEPGQSRGCPAVRQAVRRFRPADAVTKP